MKYPLISEYKNSIMCAEDNFSTLSNLRPVLDDSGNPIMSNGNFAVVFKMKDEKTGKLYAVKCFLKDQSGREEAYKLISDEMLLGNVNSYLVNFEYLSNELFVDSAITSETDFPIVKLDWVDGVPLHDYLKQNINSTILLEQITYNFSQLSAWLLTQPFAHGDLKPDNILVKEDGDIVLVDYDGMYVSCMKGKKARELGSPDYRHPLRTECSFDERIDDMAIISILLSLKAISLNPSLLKKYGNNEKLLMGADDYLNISNSQVLKELFQLTSDVEFCKLYGLFMMTIANNDLSQVHPKELLCMGTKRALNDVLRYAWGKTLVEEERYEDAYLVFEEMAKHGSEYGQNGLGYCFAKGYYVSKNIVEAVKWFRKSAENGFWVAQNNLGNCYMHGMGVEEDRQEATKWHNLCTAKGLGPAQELFDSMMNWDLGVMNRHISKEMYEEEIEAERRHYEEVTTREFLL